MTPTPINGPEPPEPPPVVGKRNHFESAESYVDTYWVRLPVALRTPELRDYLIHFTAGLIRQMAWYFSVGAQRGIEQTAKLIVDPEFYATVKERRRRERERQEAYQHQQEQERLERTQCPTAEQVEEMRHSLEQYIKGYENQIASWKARLDALPANPKHIRMPDRKEA